jgi:hypothetical protein
MIEMARFESFTSTDGHICMSFYQLYGITGFNFTFLYFFTFLIKKMPDNIQDRLWKTRNLFGTMNNI